MATGVYRNKATFIRDYRLHRLAAYVENARPVSNPAYACIAIEWIVLQYYRFAIIEGYPHLGRFIC